MKNKKAVIKGFVTFLLVMMGFFFLGFYTEDEMITGAVTGLEKVTGMVTDEELSKMSSPEKTAAIRTGTLSAAQLEVLTGDNSAGVRTVAEEYLGKGAFNPGSVFNMPNDEDLTLSEGDGDTTTESVTSPLSIRPPTQEEQDRRVTAVSPAEKPTKTATVLIDTLGINNKMYEIDYYENGQIAKITSNGDEVSRNDFDSDLEKNLGINPESDADVYRVAALVSQGASNEGWLDDSYVKIEDKTFNRKSAGENLPGTEAAIKRQIFNDDTEAQETGTAGELTPTPKVEQVILPEWVRPLEADQTRTEVEGDVVTFYNENGEKIGTYNTKTETRIYSPPLGDEDTHAQDIGTAGEIYEVGNAYGSQEGTGLPQSITILESYEGFLFAEGSSDGQNYVFHDNEWKSINNFEDISKFRNENGRVILFHESGEEYSVIYDNKDGDLTGKTLTLTERDALIGASELVPESKTAIEADDIDPADGTPPALLSGSGTTTGQTAANEDAYEGSEKTTSPQSSDESSSDANSNAAPTTKTIYKTTLPDGTVIQSENKKEIEDYLTRKNIKAKIETITLKVGETVAEVEGFKSSCDNKLNICDVTGPDGYYKSFTGENRQSEAESHGNEKNNELYKKRLEDLVKKEKGTLIEGDNEFFMEKNGLVFHYDPNSNTFSKTQSDTYTSVESVGDFKVFRKFVYDKKEEEYDEEVFYLENEQGEKLYLDPQTLEEIKKLKGDSEKIKVSGNGDSASYTFSLENGRSQEIVTEPGLRHTKFLDTIYEKDGKRLTQEEFDALGDEEKKKIQKSSKIMVAEIIQTSSSTTRTNYRYDSSLKRMVGDSVVTKSADGTTSYEYKECDTPTKCATVTFDDKGEPSKCVGENSICKDLGNKMERANTAQNKHSSRQFFSQLETTLTRFSGLGYYATLFFEEGDLDEWRNSVDEAFSTLYLGTEYWTSEICAADIERDQQGVAYVDTKLGLAGVAAHIQATRSEELILPGIDYDEKGIVNSPREFLYKVTFNVRNGDYDTDPNALEKLKFNVELRGERTINIYKQKITVDKGSSHAALAGNSFVQYSNYFYDTVCLIFDDAPTSWRLSDDTVCNTIQGPTSPSSTGGSSSGGSSSGGSRESNEGDGDTNDV
ncbi:hypothetical protein ISS07_02160 [Candidatus Woesearchaeota archaeon]|nr:hypothetical protein [Candidatus Woesearchaeota archaeon]